MTEAKRKLLIRLAVGIAAIAAGVYFFVLRDTRSDCQRFVGPIAELERLTGQALELEYHYSGKYHCSQTITSRADRRTTIVSLDVEDARNLASTRDGLDRDGFIKTIPLSISSNAALFIAGPSVQPTTDQLHADAVQRVQRGSRDGIGDALAALPPSKHVVLFEIGGRMIKIYLDATMFTAEKAIAYAEAVAKRVRE